MMAYDRYWGIVLRGQPVGVNSRVQCWYWFRDPEIDELIIERVKEAYPFKDDPVKMDAYGKREDIKEIAKRFRKRAFAMTMGRDKDEFAFEIPWPPPELRGYMDVIPKANAELAVPSPSYPMDREMQPLEPILALEGHGWIHEYPIVWGDHKELSKVLVAWPGKPVTGDAYTLEQLEKQKRAKKLKQSKLKLKAKKLNKVNKKQVERHRQKILEQGGPKPQWTSVRKSRFVLDSVEKAAPARKTKKKANKKKRVLRPKMAQLMQARDSFALVIEQHKHFDPAKPELFTRAVRACLEDTRKLLPDEEA